MGSWRGQLVLWRRALERRRRIVAGLRAVFPLLFDGELQAAVGLDHQDWQLCGGAVPAVMPAGSCRAGGAGGGSVVRALPPLVQARTQRAQQHGGPDDCEEDHAQVLRARWSRAGGAGKEGRLAGECTRAGAAGAAGAGGAPPKQDQAKKPRALSAQPPVSTHHGCGCRKQCWGGRQGQRKTVSCAQLMRAERALPAAGSCPEHMHNPSSICCIKAGAGLQATRLPCSYSIRLLL